jgi:hypothetical protein
LPRGLIPSHDGASAAIVAGCQEFDLMHESHEIEYRLKTEAERIGRELGGVPVVVIAAGDTDAGIPRTMTGSNLTGRLRDLLGILQTAIQIETHKHFTSE